MNMNEIDFSEFRKLFNEKVNLNQEKSLPRLHEPTTQNKPTTDLLFK